MATTQIIIGDALEQLRLLPAGTVQTCVTSPPYYGLRDYGHAGQIGLEPTPDEYVARLVAVFSEVRRVLADDGTCWINLGDSYAGSATSGGENKNSGGDAVRVVGVPVKRGVGIKPKDLIGIPWRVAFALQADGWYLRSDIIWHKPNPMPESVTDRPTKAHEYLFLLSKSERYYYDSKAIMEPAIYGAEHAAKATSWGTNRKHPNKANTAEYAFTGDNSTCHKNEAGEFMKNKRTVWTVASEPYAGAHFAVMPTRLVEPCILAGCPTGGIVLDPFAGAGTVGLVASRRGRSFIGIELNPIFAAMAEDRINDDAPLLAWVQS